MERLTKSVVTEISGEMRKAAEAVAAKYGLTVQPHGGTFTESEFTPRFTFVCPEASEEKAGLVLFMVFGEQMIGKSFVAKGQKMVVVGYNPKRPKNPVVLQDTEGRRYKCSEAYLKLQLAKK